MLFLLHSGWRLSPRRPVPASNRQEEVEGTVNYMLKELRVFAVAGALALAAPVATFAQHGGGHGSDGARSSAGDRGRSANRGGERSAGRSFSGRNEDRGRGREFRERNERHGRDFDRGSRFSFGFAAPFYGGGYYGPSYYGYADPCGYYDQWGYWHANPACYADPYSYGY